MMIGEAVRLIRTRANHSQSQMATALDVTPSRISQIETTHYGNKRPSLELMAKIREVYGFCPMALVVLADESLDIEAHKKLIELKPEVPNT